MIIYDEATAKNIAYLLNTDVNFKFMSLSLFHCAHVIFIFMVNKVPALVQFAYTLKPGFHYPS